MVDHHAEGEHQRSGRGERKITAVAGAEVGRLLLALELQARLEAERPEEIRTVIAEEVALPAARGEEQLRAGGMAVRLVARLVEVRAPHRPEADAQVGGVAEHGQ